MLQKLAESREFSTFAGRVGLAVVLQGIGAALAFLMQVLLARWMHAESYGVYSYAFAWATLIAVIGGLGFPTGVLRFIPAYRAAGDHARLNGVIRASVAATLVAGLSVWLVVSAVLGIHSLVTGGQVHVQVMLVLLLAPLIALMTLLTEVIRAFHRIILAFVPSLVGRPLFVILAAGTFLALGGDLTPTAALVITTAGIAVLALVQGLTFWRGLMSDIRLAPPAYEAREWARVALPLLVMAGFGVIMSQADVILVGAISGAKDAGLYNAAAKSANLVGMVLAAVNAISTPTLSAQWARGELKDMQRLATHSAALAFWPSAVICLFLAIAAGPILSLFGGQFADATPVLIVLLVGQLVNAGAGSVGYIMIVTGHQSYTVRVYSWVTLGHLVMTPLAILAIGSLGAAIVTSITFAAWNIALSILTVRKVGIHASVLSSVRGVTRSG